MTTASEEQIAALQARIRRAGERTRQLRRLVLVVLLLALGSLLVVRITQIWTFYRDWFAVDRVINGSPGWFRPPVRDWLQWAVTVSGLRFLGWGLVSFLLAASAAAVYRGRRRTALHRELRDLSPSEAAQVLRPLELDSLGDTRKIVAGLTRRLRVPSELSPAEAPTGRGDEPSPTE
jgi:hypothetical protein